MDDHREEDERLVLVVRNPAFGLPTACPNCLPVFYYLKLAGLSFDLHYDTSNPDSDDIPYLEHGDAVAFNSEKGGAIEALKEDKFADLDSKLAAHVVGDFVSTTAMIMSWLAEATDYEVWVASDGHAATIYFSDLPWPVGKMLHWKQARGVRRKYGITGLNSEEREQQIYGNGLKAYKSLSMRLADKSFFFEDRPTSVDALFLGHAVFVLNALPETSVLRSHLLQHENLVRYARNMQVQYLEASSSSSSSSIPRSPSPRARTSQWNAKPKKKDTTPEEKTFRRRAKYFLATQLVAIVVFLSVLGGLNGHEMGAEEEDED